MYFRVFSYAEPDYCSGTDECDRILIIRVLRLSNKRHRSRSYKKVLNKSEMENPCTDKENGPVCFIDNENFNEYGMGGSVILSLFLMRMVFFH